ncbi:MULTISPECIES: RHS repeat-associated core domain-containing protein [unclassified Nonomuraea]|uniref:RHS repeat-associated core domain-containing protein n=1 Tax=unclassified Nonomuraea TaxID=2593643 RepID=UPI0033DC6C19
MPGILALQAQAVVVDPVPNRLAIPGSPASGSAGTVPVQQSGTAANLPHLVDPAATQPKPKTEDKTKSAGEERPKGSLPLEKAHEVLDEPATDGLNSPPPLTWDSSSDPAVSAPAKNDGRQTRVRAESAAMHKVSLGSATQDEAKATRTQAVTAAALPAVSGMSALPGQQTSGLWTFPSTQPTFYAYGGDADSRTLRLEAQVEHDPSVAAQGMGLIWSGTGSLSSSGCYTTSKCWLQTPAVASGKLKDGWLVRWRVRVSTSGGVVSAWSAWQAARVDTSKPVVSEAIASPGQVTSGIWSLPSTQPSFYAYGGDPESRTLRLEAQVEHDPSVATQGTGLIWSGSGSLSSSGCYTTSRCYLQSPVVASGKLKDGWLVRWRVRVSASDGVAGPWSEWQGGRVDTSKPVVSEQLASPGQQVAGLWTLSSVQPSFYAYGGDPESRTLRLEAQVEHDPSVATQGTGLIWSGSGSLSSSGCYTTSRCYLQSPVVASGKLKDGWLVRWRVRVSASDGVAGPWSEWQESTVAVSGTAGNGLGAVPATRGTDSWTLASVTPWLYAKVTDAGGSKLVLGAEIEHDPAVPAQGTGLIWSGKATTSYASGGNAWLQVPAGQLTDGMKVRWRVRGVTTAGVEGEWSAWQSAAVDVTKPAASDAGLTPATKGATSWTASSVTPWLYAKVSDPDSRASKLSVQVEHDPAVPAQGTGLIWEGKGATAYASGGNAWVQVPAAKLTDGMKVRWRVRGETTTGALGPWTDWSATAIDLNKPAIQSLGMDPALPGSASWTAGTVTPWLFAKVSDPENRSSKLDVEVEHDPAVPAQGAGLIWSGSSDKAYAPGTNAWAVVPSGKLTDGWQIRWRARATTTSGASGPWSEWVSARVDTTVFKTIPPGPAVSEVSAPTGQLVTGKWILPTTSPSFTAAISDVDRRPGALEAEVEHDPAVPAQGTGLIWSGQSTTFDETCFKGQTCWASHESPAVTGLQNGWHVRWRVRAVVQSTATAGALVSGPWSEWQSARVDTSKPVVSEQLASPGQQVAGLWTLPSTQPSFYAYGGDPDSRKLRLEAQIEHDPSAAGQGSGLIWAAGGTLSSSGCYTTSRCWLQSPAVASGKLKDGWLVRWRVRVSTADQVAGPWSEWQSGRVDTSKPVVSEPLASPGQQASGLWTLPSTQPTFYAYGGDPDSRPLRLEAQIEHDPSAASQGSGLIWAAGGAVSSGGCYTTSRCWLQTPTVASGELKDGWLIRWRVRASTAEGEAGPWSEWQSARIDASKPVVSEQLASPGQQVAGMWTLPSTQPTFYAYGGDPDSRPLRLEAQVEHDPAVATQGTGLIWSGTGTVSSGGCYTTSRCWLQSPAVASGKLKDGWLVRWRVRVSTADGITSQWSEWQAGRVDTSKPVVSEATASPGQQVAGLWTLSSAQPTFYAYGGDPDSRPLRLEAQVEHDPAVAAQGTGLIWSGTGTVSSGGCYTTSRCYLQSPAVTAGKLKDGWLVRWRVRVSASDGVAGPWSEWQESTVAVSGTAGNGLGAVPATRGTDSWTLASVTPWLYAKVTDAGGSKLVLGAEIEHDPAVPAQGTGLIWSGKATTSYASGGNAWLQVPAGQLTDGMKVRWRVRGVTTAGAEGEWSPWQSASVDVTKPAASDAGLTPATKGATSWTASSVTPWFYAKVSDPDSRASKLSVQVEHDPTATGQGSGLIWEGKGTTAYASGGNAWAQVPAGKLTDGMKVRWRVRGETTTGTLGPWTDWTETSFDLRKPSVSGLSMTPATWDAGTWTAAATSPWLYAKVTDPETRDSLLAVEIEHDPAATGQGSGLIWTGKSAQAYHSGDNALVQVPGGKLTDGMRIRWRARAETTSGAISPWSDWTQARVDLNKPSVESLGMDPALQGSASWTAGTVTPWLFAKVTDPDNRSSKLDVEVEHDPAAAGQGTGLIWSGSSDQDYATATIAWAAVPAGKLTDGWQIRWRARATTTSGASGPWSAWVSARVDTAIAKTIPPGPVVSTVSAPVGQLVSGKWILPSTSPSFTAAIADADRRPGVLQAEVEHDPAATGQGTGLIWTGQSTTFGDTCFTNQTCSASHESPEVTGLQNGWQIRWRVRAVVQSTAAPGALVPGPWSEWQFGRVDTSKPVTSDLLASPGQQVAGLWTLPSTQPSFYAYGGDPDARALRLEAQIEHDPSATTQGTGLIWSGTGTVSSGGCYTTSRCWLQTPAVTTGKLKDGWLIRWRVRVSTSGSVASQWSDWQAGRVDTSKPVVSEPLLTPGQEAAGSWTLPSTQPTFYAYGGDPDSRPLRLEAQVEHDPSAAGQGSGLIWSGTGTVSSSGCYTTSKCWLQTPAVTTGKLKDGWLIRWRVRVSTAASVASQWTEWQAGRVDTSKPVVSEPLASPGQQVAGLWTLPSTQPSFYAYGGDADSRPLRLEAQVEHNPSAAGQGSGLIWSGTGTVSSGGCYTTSKCWLQTPAVTAGKLKDGWQVRWRVRVSTAEGVAGPWSEWQATRVDASKPVVSEATASPGQQTSGLWTLTSTQPTFYAYGGDPDSRTLRLEAQVEHDPSVTTQGTGLIWSGTGTVSSGGCYTTSKCWLQTPTVTSGKLKDGWLVRWRVRVSTAEGIAGPWTEWQASTVAVSGTAGDGLGAVPATRGTDSWTLASITPWLYAKVTDAGGSKLVLGAEIEHDPAAPAQGTGLIWSGKGTTQYASGGNAWLQVPAGKLTDGMKIRWRVRGITTAGAEGEWSPWQNGTVDLGKPSIDGLGMNPAIRGTTSWTAESLTPWMYAKITDPENRPGKLDVQVEHDPANGDEGTGLIWSGTSDKEYASGTNAWTAVPADKLTDGWHIRWRARATTTSGVSGPWSDWVYASVAALPFESFSPANNSQVGSLAPVLSANARPFNKGEVKYWFQICAGSAPNWRWCKDSAEKTEDWTKEGVWQVVDERLKWGETYSWMAKAATTYATVASSWRTFTLVPEQANINGLLAGGTQDQEFNHMSGNYAPTTTDASVAVLGPPLSVSRTYNSLDPRTDGIFGAGWTTRWDMRIEEEPTGSLLVTYPSGEQLRFVLAGNGTYAPPSGTFATMAAEQTGGWRLMDKSATSYWFDTSGSLTKITDRRGRAQQLTRGTDGKLTKVTATGGRSLTFTWVGNHVASVSTDPVDGNPLTWTYTYTGDQLVKVCPPTSVTACTTYEYGTASRYKSVITDSGPEYYYRLNEAETRTGTTVTSAAGWNITEEQAKLNGTTPADLGPRVPGALAGSPDTAMRFKGAATSTYVQLPPNAISGQGGDLAVEAWFKTTASGTIIGMQNTGTNGPSAFTPVVYVGTDGKLRGQFFTGSSTVAQTPITSTGAVNDGSWHHAVLSSVETKPASSSEPAEHTQTLYLDGAAMGTLAGEIQHGDMAETRIGSGYGSTAWPSSTTTTTLFPFNGDIDEVAIYGRPMGAAAVQRHFAAGKPQPQLTKVTQPSGRVWAVNAYNPDGGRLVTYTDSNGGTWKLSDPVYAKQTTISTFATVTVTDPDNGVVTYVSDAQRGYRDVAVTDQVGATMKYTYDVGGYPAKAIDPNGNVVELAYNGRGNLLSRKTCRTAGVNCSTEYYNYFNDTEKPFDPRNDVKIAQRDGRSASPTDESYMTSWTHNSFGEEIKITTPATEDFPTGRSTSNTYTDGTEPAAGGGTMPAGLTKAEKDFKGNETTYAYNAAGDLVTETLPSGLVKKYTYDALGRVISTTEISKANPEGVTTTTSYDGMGKPLTKAGPGIKNDVDGKTHTLKWSATYDADGLLLTETSADLTGGDAARTTTYTYDANGRQETVTDPEGAVTRSRYDGKGQKTTSTDPRGATLAYTYTPRGELATTVLKGWTGSPLDPQPATDVVMESIAYDPAGRIASKTDAMGRTTTYTYYADNLPFEATTKGAKLNGSATGRDVVLDSRVYDAAAQLVRQTTNGGTLRVDAAYDAAGRISSQVVDPETLARKTSFTYDANNNVTKVTRTAAGTSRSEVSEFEYDVLDQPIRQTLHNDGADLVTTLTVDDRGLVTAMTDPRGNAAGADPADFTTSVTYSTAGQPMRLEMPAVQVERNGGAAVTERPTSKLGYNTFGERTHQVDPVGRTTTAAYDRAGRVITQALPAYTPPGGQLITPTTTAEYDAAGQLVKATGVRGQVTTAVYDVLGRKVKVTDPPAGGAAAGTWTFGYDLLGESSWTVDPTGARSEATYDDLGRQITLSTIERKPTPGVYVTKLDYDDAGRVVKTTRPTGDASTRAYDATGALTKQTDALGNATTFGYDLAGRPTTTTNALGLTSTAFYDLAGRKTETQEQDATGKVLRTVKAGYDLAGNPISSTSGEGHTVIRTYDAANRMTSLVEQVSASEQITSTFGYDAAGAQTRTTNGRGNSTYTTYNSLGLVETVIEPATAQHPDLKDRTWTVAYDVAGNPAVSLAPGGVRVERTFDELNRLVTQTGTGAEADTEAKRFGYDSVGRMITANDLTFTLNDRGQLLKSSSAVAGDLNVYAYDADNRVVQRIDGTGTSTFTWDDADRLTQSVDPVSGTTIDYTYDKANRLTGMAYGAGGARRTYGYDDLSRLAKDTLTTSAAGPIASIEYGYDLDDNMTSKTTTGTAGAGKNTYTYDWANRLTSWTAPDGAKTDYGWDAAGNRVKAGDKTYTYDERDRLTAGDGKTYTYTARGTLAEEGNGMVRLTKSDAFDRLVNDDGVQYDYDALDRVETRTQGGKTQRMTYDGTTNNLVAVTDTATGVKTAMFGRDALGRTLGLSDGASAGAQLAFCDLRGDLIGAFTATGTSLIDSVAYNPFGEVVTRTGAVHSLGYQGAYTDPSTGKVNMAARWYQPTTGSFISRDTLTQSADPSVQLNRYTYANDNPLTNVDPDGHASCAKKPYQKKCEKQYDKCVDNGFKGKKCDPYESFYNDCTAGLTKDKGCKSANEKYNDCRFAGSKAKTCEEKAVYSACVAGGGGGTCSGQKKVYAQCMAGKNSDRVGCIEAGPEYQECMHRYSNTTKVCRGSAIEYAKCRGDREHGGDTDQCKVVSEAYSVCAYKGGLPEGLGGRHGNGNSAKYCQGIAADATQCLTKIKGSLGDCFAAAVVELDCMAKKHKMAACGKLGDSIRWCIDHPTSTYCDSTPGKHCVRSEKNGHTYRTCTTYYSPVQAWFMSNIYKKEKGMTAPGICDLSKFLGRIPGAKTAQGAADTVCGAIKDGIDLLDSLGPDVDAMNKKWDEFRTKYPGRGINVREKCMREDDGIGLKAPWRCGPLTYNPA